MTCTDKPTAKMMIAKNLKALRNKHKLTQEQAARLVHVTLRTWTRYESGETAAPGSVLELFCLKLGEPYPDALIKTTTNDRN